MVRRRLQWWLWAYGLICFIASVLQTGYTSSTGNRAIHIALIHFLRDPSLYPNDPIRDTFQYYVSLLWWLVAALPKDIPLEWAEFVFFLIVRALVFLSAVRLVQVLVPDNGWAIVGVLTMLALVPRALIGAATILDNCFEQSGTAILFILLALIETLKRRYWHAALWLGIVANLTFLYAVYILPYILVLLLAVPIYRKEWKRWLPAASLAILVASPIVLFAWIHPAQSPHNVEDWYRANYVRSAFHTFPLSVVLSDYASTVPLGFRDGYSRLALLFAWRNWLILAGAIWLTLLLSKRVAGAHQIWYSAGVLWSLVAVFWTVAALVVAYAVRCPLLMRLQPAKAVDLWVLLAGLLTVVITSHFVEQATRKPFSRHSVESVILWALFINLWSFKKHPEMSLLLVIGVVVAYCMSSLVARRKNSDPWLGLQQGLVIASLVLVMIVGTFRLTQLQPNRLRFARDVPYFQVARWAVRNTSREALFLVPTGWESFRAISQRNVFVTWKDGTHILFAPHYTEHWVTRIAEIGVDVRRYPFVWYRRPNIADHLEEAYLQLTDQQVKQLVEKYGIDYWIVHIDKSSRFETVYSDGRWKVLQVRAPASSTTPTSQPNRNIHK